MNAVENAVEAALGKQDPTPTVMTMAEDAIQSSRDPEATRALLQHILDIVAEVEEDPNFAGFQLQEARNDLGKLLAVRLMACENVAGVVSARML